MTFTSIDYDRFRALRVTHVAPQPEELIRDESNDTLTPEQLFLTAVNDALEGWRLNKVDKLIRQAGFPIPDPRSLARRSLRSATGTGTASPSCECDVMLAITDAQMRRTCSSSHPQAAVKRISLSSWASAPARVSTRLLTFPIASRRTRS